MYYIISECGCIGADIAYEIGNGSFDSKRHGSTDHLIQNAIVAIPRLRIITKRHDMVTLAHQTGWARSHVLFCKVAIFLSLCV